MLTISLDHKERIILFHSSSQCREQVSVAQGSRISCICNGEQRARLQVQAPPPSPAAHWQPWLAPRNVLICFQDALFILFLCRLASKGVIFLLQLGCFVHCLSVHCNRFIGMGSNYFCNLHRSCLVCIGWIHTSQSRPNCMRAYTQAFACIPTRSLTCSQQDGSQTCFTEFPASWWWQRYFQDCQQPRAWAVFARVCLTSQFQYYFTYITYINYSPLW